MTDKKPESNRSDALEDTSRRRFLQGSVASAASALVLPQMGSASTADAGALAKAAKIKRPNFLILMCDEMRFPPVYESNETKQFRATYLNTQNTLRQNGVDFQRH